MKLLMVHGINAYGMAHLRRFNENNVDLNRNWDNVKLDDWDTQFSQPEVAAVKRSLSRWVEDGGRLDVYFDFHCLTAVSDDLLMIRATPVTVPPVPAAMKSASSG